MGSEIIYPARDAATLVIFRDRPGHPAELLMVERSREMEFAGGALVFPGGAVDADDVVTAARHGVELVTDEAVARVAAIRETLEESGLILGVGRSPEAWVAREMRSRLLDGEAFGGLLAEYGLELDLGRIVPFARWCPNHNHPRNYDTRFYLARLPDNSPDACVDATENVHLVWASAQDVLNRADCGEFRLVFPTKRNLERLAQFSDFASARNHALSIAVRTIFPWLEDRADGRHLCIPGDLGYPVTSELMSKTLRGLP